jgi:pectate lyase
VWLVSLAACAGRVDERSRHPVPGGHRAANVQPSLPTPGPVGWASVDALGQNGTTGGGALPPVVVSSLEELVSAVAGTNPAVIRLARSISGAVAIGSHKTIEGAPGVVFQGHLELAGSVNVIVRGLTVRGYNCVDRSPCKRGADAVSVTAAAHHIWFDHCDISDGSDGNLDITHRSDYVTVSWTKFWYSSRRAAGHQYSNLISSSDAAIEDAGYLRVTFHHNWWAENVMERMPRVRFGRIHVFNNLYTCAGNQYCIGLGIDSHILAENNAFLGVQNPINSFEFSNDQSVLISRGNLFQDTVGTTEGKGSAVFVPPYPYRLAAADTVQAAVTSGAGPR